MEDNTIRVDGKEVPVSVKQLTFVTIPFIPDSIPGIRERVEALVAKDGSGVGSTRSMPSGGVMAVIRSDSPEEAEKARQLLTDLLAK